MKINAIISSTLYNPQIRIKIPEKDNKVVNNTPEFPMYRIAFASSMTPKSIQFVDTKKSILKIIDSKLQFEEKTLDQIMTDHLIRFTRTRITKRRDFVLKRGMKIINNPNLSKDKKMKMIDELCQAEKLRAIVSSAKHKDRGKDFVDYAPKENTDYNLLYNFKAAINDGNYDLEKVYNDYYAGLKDCKTIGDIYEKYPAIFVPRTPEHVISRRIIGFFGEEEYKTVDEYYTKMKNGYNEGDEETAKEYQDKVNHYLSDILTESAKGVNKPLIDAGIDFVNKSEDFTEAIGQIILANIRKIKNENGEYEVDRIRKYPSTPSGYDIKLYKDPNYENARIEFIKKMYLERIPLNRMKKIGDYDFKSFPGEYGVVPIDNELFKIIEKAKKLKEAQRNYGRFSEEEVAERLNYFAENLNYNDKIYEQLLSFSDDDLVSSDYPLRKMFMEELDKLVDERQSAEDTIANIKTKNLSPQNTAQLKQQKKEELLRDLKLKHEEKLKLIKVQEEFDKAIVKLYTTKMTDMASLCQNFRPQELKEINLKFANVIKDAINNQSLTEEELRSLLLNYVMYFKEFLKDSNSSIIKFAENYAKDSAGNINYEKAGIYLYNEELIRKFDQVNEPQKEELYGIIWNNIDNPSANMDAIVKYLCKYDEIEKLSSKEKLKISDITDGFNLADKCDNKFLKFMIENFYVNRDTVGEVILNDSKSAGVVIFTSDAKYQMMDRWKNLADLISKFDQYETALTRFGGKSGDNGIKKLTKPLKIGKAEYTYELKLRSIEDRAYGRKSKDSDGNDVYIFDRYDEHL